VNFFFEFRLFVVLLRLVLLVTFFVRDLFSFYFFFEVSILPTVIIIIGWGYQPERVQASFYFFFLYISRVYPIAFFGSLFSKGEVCKGFILWGVS